jgi:DNA-binding transcriptional LysR family regulator
MELPSQMVLFAKVVENGSFSAAARSMAHTPSAVSKQIGHLENRLGVRLLNRSRQGISLTEEGRAFYQRCAEVAASISEAEAMVVSLSAHPQGELRVAATVAFAKAQMLPILPAFLERNPDLRLSLEVTDRSVDLAEEGIDVAIRFSEQLDDPAVVVRKLAPNRRVICAAPAYLERSGTPRTPADLSGHNCLRLSTVARWNDWHLDGPDNHANVRLDGNFEANSADAIYHATLAGMGIARLSTYLVGADLCAGRLVRILPDYVDDSSDIVAIYGDRRNLAPKIRAFIDYLVEWLGTVPPWERAPELVRVGT